MAHTLSIRWRGSCPHHRRFNPSAGRGAVKGGCPACLALCHVYEAELRLRDAIQAAEEAIAAKKKLATTKRVEL